MPREISAKEAKQRAGRFCALRERSPNELLEKLKSWGLSQEESLEIVEDLIQQGFMDEQRFANAFCNDKFEFNSWGKQKIKAHIFSHKLSEQVVQRALNGIDPVKYTQRLFDLAKTKWLRLEDEEPIKQKQKTLAYLANKGFEVDLIWNAINELEGKGH
ncbi:regulatory protein RecX [Ekhidna sp.]|uniref:regulatory protein RecX n=1 Tax=Ekhidna sp. TaxID=2608089 RepID=UPI003298D6CE